MTALLLAGTFLITFDFFAISVALPSIREALQATPSQLQWCVAVFGVMFGATLVAGARLGERLGPLRAFRAGMGLFGMAALGCAVAQGPWQLIGARALQGLSAALLSPQVLALIGRLPQAGERERAFAGYGAALGLGSGLGQLVGGALIALDPAGLGWRAEFVLSALFASGVAWRLRGYRGPAGVAQRIDVTSVLLLAVAVVALMLPLIEGRRQHGAPWLLLPAALGAVGLVLFVARQRRLAASGGAVLVSPAVFTPRFATALVTVLTFYASVASFMLIFSLTLQSQYRLPPHWAGLVFSAMVAGFLASNFGARRLAARWPGDLLAAGTWVLAAGHALLALALATQQALAWLLLPMVLAGLGMGLVMGPLIARAMGVAPAGQQSLASGLVGSVQWFGNALGVALVGTLYFTLAGEAPAAPALAQAGAASHGVFALLALGVAALLPRWAALPRPPAAAA
ncbi:MFS transporter [Aquabacterium sp. OR-4]|uniref:MFS transporter n=1 Tax=Aquabacterium sp. OR-4 TaxID=2978127 RepID=UPI0021B247AD|nr:MFS transporter [Aquabacterium sp. OR-4]MDT7837858.1 MFS transporter [Aquabacterium sp. OR-4]